MLNQIQKRIINGIKQFERNYNTLNSMRNNILNLTSSEKAEYITELATVYKCSYKEVENAINLYLYN